MFNFLKRPTERTKEKEEKDGNENPVVGSVSSNSSSNNSNKDSTNDSNSGSNSRGGSNSDHNNISSNNNIGGGGTTIPRQQNTTFCEMERCPIYPFSNQIQLLREVETQRLEWSRFLEANPVNVKDTWLWQYWNPQNRIRNQLKKKVMSIFDSKIRTQSQLKRLLRGGIPPELRGQVWYCCSGADAKRNSAAPHEQYSALQLRFHEIVDSVVSHDINKDLPRTFPTNVWFHGKDKDAKKFNVNDMDPDDGIFSLRNVLYAYALRNPQVGYCQSMNYIAAMLLMHMSDEDAFWVLTAVVENILYQDYYSPSMIGCRVDNFVLSHLISKKLPKLTQILASKQATLDPVVCPWFLCLFINSLPAYTVCRVWDCLLWEGNTVVFRATIALLVSRKELIDSCAPTADAMALYGGLRQGAGEYKVGNFSLRPYDLSRDDPGSDDEDEDIEDATTDSQGGSNKERGGDLELIAATIAAGNASKQEDRHKELIDGPWYPGKYWHIRMAKMAFHNNPSISEKVSNTIASDDNCPVELLEDSAPDAPSYSTALIRQMYNKSVVGEVSRQHISQLRETFHKLVEDSDETLLQKRAAMAKIAAAAAILEHQELKINSSDTTQEDNKRHSGGKKSGGPSLLNDAQGVGATSVAMSSSSFSPTSSSSSSISSSSSPVPNTSEQSSTNEATDELRVRVLSTEYLSNQFELSQLVNAGFAKVSEQMDLKHNKDDNDIDIDNDTNEDYFDASNSEESLSPYATPQKPEAETNVLSLENGKFNNESSQGRPQNNNPFSLQRRETMKSIMMRSTSLQTFEDTTESYPLTALMSYRSNRGRMSGFVKLRLITSINVNNPKLLTWETRFVVVENRRLFVFRDENLDDEIYKLNLMKGDVEIHAIDCVEQACSFAIRKTKVEESRPIKLISLDISTQNFHFLEIWMMSIINASEGAFRDDEDFCAAVTESCGDAATPAFSTYPILRKREEPIYGAAQVMLSSKLVDLDLHTFFKAREGIVFDPLTYQRVKVDLNSGVLTISNEIANKGDTSCKSKIGGKVSIFGGNDDESMESILAIMTQESLISFVVDDPEFTQCICLSRLKFKRFNGESLPSSVGGRNRSNSNISSRGNSDIIGSVRIGFDSLDEKIEWNAVLCAHLQNAEQNRS